MMNLKLQNAAQRHFVFVECYVVKLLSCVAWLSPTCSSFLDYSRITNVYISAWVSRFASVTVEPRSTDTRLIRTPALYGQFRLSRQKAHIFSLKLTRFIRTPVNTDNGHFSVSRVTNSHILSTLLYGHWLSTHCLFSLSHLCDNCRHCTLFK